MLGFGWLTLRQAQEALKNGRLEDAHRLLLQPDMAGHKGSWELFQQVAQGFVERGRRHLEHDDVVAAWHDLLQAEQIGGANPEGARLRQALIRQGLEDARALLQAGEPARAAETLAQLGNRSVRHAELQLLQEVAKGWVQARALADRGEFSQAQQTAEHISQLLPQAPATLLKFRKDLEKRGQAFADLLGRLLAAADQKCWREALLLAEQVLALAPQHVEARKVRARVWKSIEPATIPVPQASAEPARPPTPAEEPGPRFMLWIDGVGAYLVCLGNRVTLGQATPDTAVDIPLYADVSRMHAVLSRDAEGYLLEAVRSVRVNGRQVDKVLLQPGDRVTLGSCCQLQFGQPVPVSATAQLDLASGHRLPLTVSKVFLMADTLVLGPDEQSHVLMPDLHQPVVLFRQKDGLGVRYGGDFMVDGEVHRERGILAKNARVTGDHFALAVEQIGTRMGHS